MAVRAVKVGDAWTNHIERNIVEFWKVDDDAGGAVAAATVVPLATAGRRAIGSIGTCFSLDANKRISIYTPAIPAGYAEVFMVIFEAGPN